MEKEYVYENAIVQIKIPNDMSRVYKATETFLKKILAEEQCTYGNSNTTGTIKEK